MKLPAFQFYPADWRKDPGVQALSYHDRGVWFEILCLMHESDERGKLTLNGKPMPEDALARLLGLDKQNLTKVISTLLEYGVASRDEAGFLICRRMVKDEKIRQARASAGQKGGLQRLDNEAIEDLLKQKSSKKTKQVKQKPTPSSSSSSSLKKPYGENVLLLEEEFEKLKQEHGPSKTELILTTLRNYKKSSGKTYKDDYAAINSWVIDRVNEKLAKGQTLNGHSNNGYKTPKRDERPR